ncbi:MAG: cysteine desulfurase family protein [Pirellulales bacterium]
MAEIYLDSCSTTPLDPRVGQAMLEAAARHPGNPASPHRFGQAARRQLELARETIAQALGADVAEVGGDRLVFTSGGTESNNLALRGLLGPSASGPTRIVVSSVEHPSVMATAQEMARLGYDVQRAPVDGDGVIRLDQLESLLTPATRLVSIQWGNHETGVIQPIHEIAQLCRDRQILFHCDAVQAVGKVRIHFRESGVDALTFTAHKIHGPVGIGALLLRPGVVPAPLHWGGSQQLGVRPGTESLMLAVGFATALQLAVERLRDTGETGVSSRRDQLEELLLQGIPDLWISGRQTKRLPHVTNAAFPELDRQQFLLALDNAGVACSSGPACQSGASELSPVLQAMGLPHDVLRSSLRLSVSTATTPEDVSEAARRIVLLWNDLRQKKQAGNYSSSPRLIRRKPL